LRVNEREKCMEFNHQLEGKINLSVPGQPCTENSIPDMLAGIDILVTPSTGRILTT
jgi:hypothetical protein